MYTMEEMDVGAKGLMGLLFGTVSTQMVEFMKKGIFSFPSDSNKVDLLFQAYASFREFALNKRITPASMFKSSKFTIAFRNLVSMHDFQEDIWGKKLDNRWFELKPQLDSRMWTKALVDIYNWKNQAPIIYGS